LGSILGVGVWTRNRHHGDEARLENGCVRRFRGGCGIVDHLEDEVEPIGKRDDVEGVKFLALGHPASVQPCPVATLQIFEQVALLRIVEKNPGMFAREEIRGKGKCIG
jgi:hypothetical protein